MPHHPFSFLQVYNFNVSKIIQEGQAYISHIVCTAFTLKYYNELMVLVVSEKKKYSRLDSLESIYEANLKKHVVWGTEFWIYKEICCINSFFPLKEKHSQLLQG